MRFKTNVPEGYVAKLKREKQLALEQYLTQV